MEPLIVPMLLLLAVSASRVSSFVSPPSLLSHRILHNHRGQAPGRPTSKARLSSSSAVSAPPTTTQQGEGPLKVSDEDLQRVYGSALLRKYAVKKDDAIALLRMGEWRRGTGLISRAVGSNPRGKLLLLVDGSLDIRDAADDSVMTTLPAPSFIGEMTFLANQLLSAQGEDKGPADSSSNSGSSKPAARVFAQQPVTYISWEVDRLNEFLAGRPALKAALTNLWTAELIQKARAVPPAARGGALEIEAHDAWDADKDLQRLEEWREAAAYGYRDDKDLGPLDMAVPANGWSMGVWNFKREWLAIRRAIRFGDMAPASGWANAEAGDGPFAGIVRILRRWDLNLDDVLATFNVQRLTPSKVQNPTDENTIRLRQELSRLRLDNDAVWRREEERVEKMKFLLEKHKDKQSAPPDTDLAVDYDTIKTYFNSPLLLKIPYLFLCWLLDVLYNERPIQRFWFLETVARMPYFAYISMLHLYETLGWWRVGTEVRKVHFAEEWNEMHHLFIMESLGGDQAWFDRFLARHAAIVYYWVVIFLFLISPTWAYNFSELVEWHATDTYAEFVEQNKDRLKRLPAPAVALEYYNGGDLYLFDEFQSSRPAESRRPNIDNLYDVFVTIRDDELEHVKTMSACQRLESAMKSPNAAAAAAGLAPWAEPDKEEEPAGAK
mmetsp:Transcript_28736/g.82920  ORF Transcript_28736/g.82920 Transcript_28736/m.82920 type:complete len:665 (-) Transcript_28736:658-2652(-)